MAPGLAEATAPHRTRLIASAAQAEGMIEDWQRLARAPLVPCGGCLPGWIVPQLRHFNTSGLLVFGAGAAGIFPLQRQSRRWGLGWPVLSSWATPLSFSGLPLLAEGDAAWAVQSLLEDMDAAALLLQSIPADGPLRDCLAEATARAGAQFHVFETWQRAALQPQGTFASWFDKSFERKRRKEYRRLRTRLAEAGCLERVAWESADDLQPWIDELIALEARGWKGRRGTALASAPAVAACLTEALRALAQDGALRFWKLSIDGKAIAMLFAIVHGSQAWLGKIAYDEDLGKFSPGALLILDATQHLMEEPAIALVDSCAIPGHPLIEHLWRDRVAMADVMIGAPDASPAKFKAMIGAETLRRRARLAARGAWHAVSGGRRT